MIEKSRLALNRMAAPALDLEEFYRLATETGIFKVELRNDIPGRAVTDGLSRASARGLARSFGVEVVTINAQQKFNLKSKRTVVRDELESLLDTAAELSCRAVILCPNNEADDDRPPEIRFSETAEALLEFGPLFLRYGVFGYVEPLGFGVSSLASPAGAAGAIRASGYDCYRVVHDSFHHYIGPDTPEIFGADFSIDLIGLVHISGVEEDIPASDYRDEHRIFPGPEDRTACKEQLNLLLRRGYRGDVSFEPFSSEFGRMPAEEIKALIRASVAYITDR